MGVIWGGDIGLTVNQPPQLIAGSPIMLIGDEPGVAAVASSLPFAGLTHLVLSRLLDGIGLQLSNVSCTCVSKTLQDTPDLEPWIKVLKSELEDSRYRPNVAVVIGELGLHTLCGVRGIHKYRGSVLASTLVSGLKVIPIVPPKYIFGGNFGDYFIAQHDMQRIKAESQYPEIRRKQWQSITGPGFGDVIAYLKNIKDTEPWSIDIETRADSLACLALAAGVSALCIPIQTTTGPYFLPAQELEVWHELGRLMRRNPNLVGQNLTFDLEWLLSYGILPKFLHMDTMLAFALLYPEFPKGLDMITSIYTDVPYYKDDGKTWGWQQPDQKLWQYNCNDAFYTLDAAHGIEQELRNRGLWKFYHDYVNKEVFAALEMQRTRLKRNDANHTQLKTIAASEADATNTMLALITGRSLNVNSPKQIKDYLYTTKAFRPIVVQGKITADENSLKKLRTQHSDCAELELIIKERHLRKKLSSYLDIELDPDGYVGCAWNIAGTETGRWSSGKSAHRRGLNIQTVPKLLRYEYEAPPGRVFIQPDLSQAEARVVANLASCKPLMDLFADPKRSVHMENGVAIFGYAPVKDSKEYVLAKQCLHAANYMMQADRFAVETGISVVRAKEILSNYHAAYPELAQWHQRTRETILQVGKLITPFGRERIFYGARAEVMLTGSLSAKTWRNAVAYVPQATVPDVLNHGMLKTWSELDYMWLHHQGHDSCLVSVPLDKLGECAERLSKNLTFAIPVGSHSLTIPVEVAWGFLWNPMLSWKGERDATLLRPQYDAYVAKVMTHTYIADNLS